MRQELLQAKALRLLLNERPGALRGQGLSPRPLLEEELLGIAEHGSALPLESVHAL